MAPFRVWERDVPRSRTAGAGCGQGDNAVETARKWVGLPEVGQDPALAQGLEEGSNGVSSGGKSEVRTLSGAGPEDRAHAGPSGVFRSGVFRRVGKIESRGWGPT